MSERLKRAQQGKKIFQQIPQREKQNEYEVKSSRTGIVRKCLLPKLVVMAGSRCTREGVAN